MSVFDAFETRSSKAKRSTSSSSTPYSARVGDYSIVEGYEGYGTKSYGTKVGSKQKATSTWSVPELSPQTSTGRNMTTKNKVDAGAGNDGNGFFGDASGAQTGLAAVSVASDLFGAWNQYRNNKANRKNMEADIKLRQDDYKMRKENHDFNVNRRANLTAMVKKDRAEANRNRDKKKIPELNSRG